MKNATIVFFYIFFCIKNKREIIAIKENMYLCINNSKNISEQKKSFKN